MMLQEKFFNASDDETKEKLARSILDVGDDLVRGSMKPSKADSIAQTVKAGTALPEELQRYRPFWMLRAAAAVQADDKAAGEQAAVVLKKLGPPNPESSSYVDVMAALNIKGWLTGRSNRTAESSETVATGDYRVAAGDYPYAIPVPGRPHLVESPYSPGKYIYVQGIPPGTEKEDPFSPGKIFLVP